MAEYTLFVGVDIASETASVAYATRSDQVSAGGFTIAQDEAGREALVQRLLALGHDRAQVLVVMEATSTYWMELALDLHQAGFAVSVINPAQAHYFAQVLLKRTKTDAVDAQTLTQLAATFQPARWSPPPVIYEELRQRLSQRDELISIRQQVRNQDHARQRRPHRIDAVVQRTRQHLALLDAQIAALDKEIATLFAHDDAWAAAAQRLMSIPGIGRVAAGWLLVATLNFSFADSPEQVAAFAGLVPHQRQSGTSVRGRSAIGHAGHGRLRTALYMAALSAVQHNPIIRRFYYGLLERGKHRKVALCAAARKLVHIAWAVVTKQQMFDPSHPQGAFAASVP